MKGFAIGLLIVLVVSLIPFGYYNGIPYEIEEMVGKTPVDPLFSNADGAKIDEVNNATYVLLSREMKFYPDYGAPFMHKYNESVFLPEDIKEELKKDTQNVDTIYDAVMVALLVVRANFVLDKNVVYEENVTTIEKPGYTYVPPDEAKKVLEMVYKTRRANIVHYDLVVVQALKYLGINARLVLGVVPYDKFPVDPIDYDYIHNDTFNNYAVYVWVQLDSPIDGKVNIFPTEMTLTEPTIISGIPLYTFDEGYPAFYKKSTGTLKLADRTIRNLHIWYMKIGKIRLVYSNDAPLFVYCEGTKVTVRVGNQIVKESTEYNMALIPKKHLIILESPSCHVVFEEYLKTRPLPFTAFLAPKNTFP